MRLYGVYVNERPRMLFPSFKSAQTIITDEIRMPLKYKCLLAYLSVRKPSLEEISDDNLQHIELTSPHG